MSSLYNVLQFPERAEYLERYATYDVDLHHWRNLSTAFQRAFQTVHDRGSSAVLLVHGAQGTGKTLFSKRLQADFERTRKGPWTPDDQNLWHTLVRDEPPQAETIRRATETSILTSPEATAGWLEDLRSKARNNQDKVRIFVIDDVHKDVFLREWAGLSQAEYLPLKGQLESIIDSVAQRLVEECRGDFQRAILLLLSNKAATMEMLRERIDSLHRGLATILELPLPQSDMKERIVRKNINRLNPMSYWFCLDAAGESERTSVYEVLTSQDRGFTDSFEAVAGALASSAKPRAGRPANRNLITLVTLGVDPRAVAAFLENRELPNDEHFLGHNVGAWLMRGKWASVLYTGDDNEEARRAKMMESEFALRWIGLSMQATYALCQPPQPDDTGERLLEVLRFFPSVAKPNDLEQQRAHCHALDQALVGLSPAEQEAVQKLAEEFSKLGQHRSVLYENALRKRMPGYGQAMQGFSKLKPDYTVAPYEPCAVTEAESTDNTAIRNAIRRTCHTIEFTAHLGEDLEGLDKYLLEKVKRYANLLESV